MSEKNRDNKNRWRNVTIAFRMSPEENEELDDIKDAIKRESTSLFRSILQKKIF